jgi:hypothetical protein
MDRQPSKLGVLITVTKRLWARNPRPFYINKLISTMMQNMYIAYMRGFENKPKPKYIKGSLVEKEFDKGKKDRINKLPNRYLKE